MRKFFAIIFSTALLASGAAIAQTTGQATATAPTYTPGARPLSLDLSGGLRTNIEDSITLDVNCLSGCGGSGGTSAPFGSAFPADGTPVGGTDGTDFVPLNIDSGTGGLDVRCVSGCGGSGGTSSPFGSTFPTDGTAVGMSDGTDMVPFTSTDGTSLDVNCITGCSGGGGGGTSSNFGSAFPAAGTAAGFTDGTDMRPALVDAAGNLQIDIVGALPAGTNNIGDVDVLSLPSIPAGNNNIGDVDIASALPAGNNNIGDVDVATLPSIPAGNNNIGDVDVATLPVFGTTGGGATPGKLLSAASTNATVIKASAGTLYSITAINTTSTIYYLKLYNVATGPTCNSDTVVQTYPIPASTSGAGFVNPVPAVGLSFGTGIAFCITDGIADNNNGNAATGIAVSYSYK